MYAAVVDGVRADSLLSPDRAFRVQGRQVRPGVIELTYRIAPGYYIYRDRLTFTTATPGVQLTVGSMPAAEMKFEKAMGEVLALYSGEVSITVEARGAASSVTIDASGQGCAAVGVCYPPFVRSFHLSM